MGEVIYWLIRIAAVAVCVVGTVSAIRVNRRTKRMTAKGKDVEILFRMPKAGWYNPDDIKPRPGDTVRLDCGKFGEREAIYLDPRYWLIKWRLTDCTHPMQNMNMPDDYVRGWKPIGNTVVTEDVQYEEVQSLELVN